MSSTGVQLDAATARDLNHLLGCLDQIISALTPAITSTISDDHDHVEDPLLCPEGPHPGGPLSESSKTAIPSVGATVDAEFERSECPDTIGIGLALVRPSCNHI